MNIETGTAIGLVGLGIFQIHDAYTKHAGSLSDARESKPGARVRMQDADILVGATALVVGGALSLASKQAFPIMLAILGFAIISGYYHLALSTNKPIQEEV